MVEVIFTEEFERWWDGLAEPAQDDVDAHVGLLQEKGVALGWPYSSAIKGSKIALREHRAGRVCLEGLSPRDEAGMRAPGKALAVGGRK